MVWTTLVDLRGREFRATDFRNLELPVLNIKHVIQKEMSRNTAVE